MLPWCISHSLGKMQVVLWKESFNMSYLWHGQSPPHCAWDPGHCQPHKSSSQSAVQSEKGEWCSSSTRCWGVPQSDIFTIKPVQNGGRCSPVFTVKLHHISSEGQRSRSTEGEDRMWHWNWQRQQSPSQRVYDL
jgi:hypothetical protein